MRKALKFGLLMVAALMLNACKKSPYLFPIDGASDNKPSSVAMIREGSMLLRGMDGKAFNTAEIPNPFSDFLFSVKPGEHVFWAKNIQGGHPFVLEGLRCYVFRADVRAGVTYRVDEDMQQAQALLKDEKTGEILARGPLVDKQEAYSDECNWKKHTQ